MKLKPLILTGIAGGLIALKLQIKQVPTDKREPAFSSEGNEKRLSSISELSPSGYSGCALFRIAHGLHLLAKLEYEFLECLDVCVSLKSRLFGSAVVDSFHDPGVLLCS